MADLRRAWLRAFDAATYTARLELVSGQREVTGVPVSRGLPASELVAGRKVAVLFFDPVNLTDAVVVAVYT